MKIELQSLRGPELKAQDHYICRAQPLLRSRELFDKKGHVVTSWSNLVLFKDAVGLSSVPNASSECAVVAVGMFALFWCVPYMPKNTEWTQCACVCVCVCEQKRERMWALAERSMWFEHFSFCKPHGHPSLKPAVLICMLVLFLDSDLLIDLFLYLCNSTLKKTVTTVHFFYLKCIFILVESKNNNFSLSKSTPPSN